MTDQEINERVALARGWHTNDQGAEWFARDGSAVPWRVCTDPAAWGALFVELHTMGRGPEIIGNHQDGMQYLGVCWSADNNRRFESAAPLPGRALALAFLKAVQP